MFKQDFFKQWLPFTAGLSHFWALSSILLVNPLILQSVGFDAHWVFLMTVASLVFSALWCAYFARLPFVIGPGLGAMGYILKELHGDLGWGAPELLVAFLLVGLIFALVITSKLHHKIFNIFSEPLRCGLTSGIGLFLAVLSFQLLKIPTEYSYNPFSSQFILFSGYLPLYIALGGLLFCELLTRLKVKGELFWTILFVAWIGHFCGISGDSCEEVLGVAQDWSTWHWQANWSIFSGAWNDVLRAVFGIFGLFLVVFFDVSATAIALRMRMQSCFDAKSMTEVQSDRMLFACPLTAVIGCLGGGVGASGVPCIYLSSLIPLKMGTKSPHVNAYLALFLLLSLVFTPYLELIPVLAVVPVLIHVSLSMLGSSFSYFSPKNSHVLWLDKWTCLSVLFAIPCFMSIVKGMAIGLVVQIAARLYKRVKRLTLEQKNPWAEGALALLLLFSWNWL